VRSARRAAAAFDADAGPADPRLLIDILSRLDATYAFREWHWRPETPPLEVCFGAVLVQHTVWDNAERALASLRAAGALSIEGVVTRKEAELAELLRPAGARTVKARRLQALAALIQRVADGDLGRFLALPAAELRALLLQTHGVGPETADAIVLYAAGAPVFVIDAYTLRLFRRLGLGPASRRYDVWQRWFEAALPRDTDLYRRYHGLIVLHSKQRCRARPRCPGCPLLDLCPAGSASNSRGPGP